jgi:small subunit ribosomal protein S8
MPSSKLKAEVARILKDEGYINSYKVNEEGKKKVLRIVLRYGADGVNVISTIDRVSRPGRRVYSGAKEIPKVQGGLGVNIVTTPRGVMTGKQARRSGIGGEILGVIT